MDLKSPDFRTGVTSAIFHCLAKVLVLNELFMIQVIAGRVVDKPSV